MKQMNLLALAIVLSVCAAHAAERFEKLWVYDQYADETQLKKLAPLHVQSLNAGKATPELRSLAGKYGVEPEILFVPVGTGGHKQVLKPEEAWLQDEVNGRHEPSLKNLKGAERWKAWHDFVRVRRYSFGGEPAPENVGRDIAQTSFDCFVGAQARSNIVSRLIAQLKKQPDVGVVSIDGFGYANGRRCHHPDCERLYRQHLAENGLPDAPANEEAFFFGELVAVNNALADAVRAYDPKLVTKTHLWPVYLPQPLYGEKLRYDVIGETCAWYLKWPDEKIRAYARECVTNAPAYPRARRVPFLGFTDARWCERKTAADIERELRDILASGATELMVCGVTPILADPKVYAVFLKYF